MGSTAMMFTFAAYLGMQSFLTSTVDKDTAFASLSVVFTLFGLGQFGAAACIDFFGIYWCLVLGAWSTVAIILAAAISVTDPALDWLLFPGGVIAGCGAGFMLWAAHG